MIFLKEKNLKKKISNYIDIYRYDIFSITIMIIIILMIINPILKNGHVVFSDMAFGFTSKRYMEEIFGLWNERWSTSTLLNVGRLLYILPIYLFSSLFNDSGPILIKTFISALIINSAISMYLFSKRIISIYYSKYFNFFGILALITGALFYALNPWVIFRIQHIYLLCGYSLFPLILALFFNAFDPKFEKQLINDFNIYSSKLYKRNVLDIFLLSFFFCVSAAAIHYFFYGIIFLFIISCLLFLKNIYLVYKIDKNKCKDFTLNFIYKIILFGIFFSLFSSYWLGTYVGSILFKAQASQHNINVLDTLSLFSRNSSIKNVIYLISYWWPMFDISKLPYSFYLGGAVIISIILYAVILKSYKYHIIAFFSFCSLIFLITSTGVKLNFFSDIFVILVTKTPIIGSIFRDSNKIVGLMTVGFSILLTFGVQSILNKLENTLYHDFIKALIISTIFLSLWFYIKPFYNHFIDGFYSPINIPKEYLDVQDNFIDKDKFDSKVLYIPTADNMIQSNTGVATPFWNINNDPSGIQKATGDIQVYTSQKNTIFHHEGNSPSINKYMNFLQYVLDNGYSKNIGKLISVFGINELAYHNEYLGQESRQAFNLKILDYQNDLSKTYENRIFKLYKIKETLPYLYQVPRKIFTPNGLSKMESYSNINNFNFKNEGIIFTAMNGNGYLDKANKDDYIETSNYNDIFLSQLPEEDYLAPFDFINSGNAFINWSKTFTNNSEWLWYLSSQDIKNYGFDLDFNRGVGVTFATSKIDVLPYKMESINGKLIADFDSLLKMDKFFKPDNPGIMNVVANPKTVSNDIPLIHGEIIKGDPENIWQVAKSGIIDAKENNPYKFNILVSGRGANKIHAKVRFYNENMIELGKSYVVAPSEEVNFDSINFTGEYVSPAKSKYMRIDLLSFQKPEQNTYWWIHDVKLLDLQEYKKPNIINMNKTFKVDTKAKVYLRTFISQKGGKLNIKIHDKNIDVNTKSENINGFKWIELGEISFTKGDNKIYIENKEGFNAVNLLAIIPEDDFNNLMYKTNLAIQKCNIFSVMEAENDFSYNGNIQSDRAYPNLSFGRGISSQNGSLQKEIDIMKTDNYSIALNVNGNNKNSGKLKLSIRNNETGDTTEKTILMDQNEKILDKKTVVIDKEPFKDSFPKIYKELDNILTNYHPINIDDIYLLKGSYEITIKFESNVPSLVTFQDLHKFDPSEIKITDFAIDKFQQDASNCISITPDMMRDSVKDDVLHIDYDKTCSNDWYDYASKMIPVNIDEEYLFHAEAISENINKRHMKVLFLDKNYNFLDVTYINDVEEKDKNKWNKYEQILKVPQNTRYMQFHILTRGSRSTNGYLEMKNYYILPYRDLICIDNMVLNEGISTNNFFQQDYSNSPIIYSRIDSMQRNFTVDNQDKDRILINYMESPNLLWEMNIGSYKDRGKLVLNGVSTGFITDETGEGSVKIIMRKMYYLSFIFIILCVILFLMIYKNIEKINKYINKKRKN